MIEIQKVTHYQRERERENSQRPLEKSHENLNLIKFTKRSGLYSQPFPFVLTFLYQHVVKAHTQIILSKLPNCGSPLRALDTISTKLLTCYLSLKSCF